MPQPPMSSCTTLLEEQLKCLRHDMLCCAPVPVSVNAKPLSVMSCQLPASKHIFMSTPQQQLPGTCPHLPDAGS